MPNGNTAAPASSSRKPRVRVGVVILPEHPWRTAQTLWRRAEALGFDHAWTYDHLAWRSLRDSSWFGAIPTLTAAATATDRIRIGPLVASPNFRHPVSFAKELVSLDDISDGRLTLGIGSGGVGWDATILGEPAWSPRERADRFAEFVELTDRLLREPETDYAGRFYSADGARTYPGCTQQPRIPLAIAATGPRAMRLAATYADTWVTTGDRWSEHLMPRDPGAAFVRGQIERLEDTCAQAGTRPGFDLASRPLRDQPRFRPGITGSVRRHARRIWRGRNHRFCRSLAPLRSPVCRGCSHF